MRTRAKVDASHAKIVQALRAAGAVVVRTHQLGKGAPDCFVFYRGRWSAVEIKMPNKGLNDDQIRFAERADVLVVWSEEHALRLLIQDSRDTRGG